MILSCYLLLLASATLGATDPGTAADSRETSPSPSTAAQVRDAVRAARQRMTSLSVTYVVDHPVELAGREPLRSRHTIAADGILRFGENTHFTRSFPEVLDLNHTRVYYTGETFDVFYPRQRYYETSRRNARLDYTLKVRSDFILECLGWWPPGDDSLPENSELPHYLHLVLARNDCRVSPEQESVDGHRCHVIEFQSGRTLVDRIWLDPAFGFAVRRREKYEPGSGQLRTRYELSELREVGPGIWLPWVLRRTSFERGTAGDRSAVRVATGLVESAIVNQVAATIFKFQPPPGTLTQDRDTRELSQTPGGLEFLDETIDTLKAIIATSAPFQPQSAIGRTHPRMIAVLESPLVLPLSLAACLVVIPYRTRLRALVSWGRS